MTYRFAERLNELLNEFELSKKALAARIGVSATTITYWTHSKRQPTGENIFNLAQYFDESADYLLGLSDEYKHIKNINLKE